MSQNQTQNQQGGEAPTLAVLGWFLISCTVPLLGTALIWLFANRLKQSQKWILTATNTLLLLALLGSQPPSEPGRNLSPSTNANSPQKTAAANEKFVPLGNWAEVRDDRAVLVSRIEIVDRVALDNPFASPIQSKGGQLVIVYMSIKNTGNESGTMSWSGFQLVDAQERKYDEIQDFEETITFSRWLKARELENTDYQLFPGGTAQTAKLFRISPDATSLKLAVNQTVFVTGSSSSTTAFTAEDSSSTGATKDAAPIPPQSATVIEAKGDVEPSPVQPVQRQSAIVQPLPEQTSAPTYTVQAKDGYANLRSRPSTQVNVITKLPNGTIVTIIREQTNSSGQLWYEVRSRQQTGWLYSELVQPSEQQSPLRPGTYRMGISQYIQIAAQGNRLCYRSGSESATSTASLTPSQHEAGSYAIYNPSSIEVGVISQSELDSYELDDRYPMPIDGDLETCLKSAGNYFKNRNF